jgi:hypothetical protein
MISVLIIFGEMLKYNMNDISSIECGTRGQHENENWHRARKGLLTASRFKEVLHSRDQDAMAQRLLTPSTLDEKNYQQLYNLDEIMKTKLALCQKYARK